MWEELQKYESSGIDPSFKALDVAPATYDVRNSTECIAFVRHVGAEPNARWLTKEPQVDNSKGVKLAEGALLEKAKLAAKSGNLAEGCPASNIILQRLIHPPLLIDDHKFDIRVYVFVPSARPFAAFIYPYFAVRRSGKPYKLVNENVLTLMDGQHDNGLSPMQFAKRLKRSSAWLSQFYCNIKILLSRVLGVMRHHLRSQTSASLSGQFAMLGIDVLVGADDRQWLGEINFSPDLGMIDKRPEWWKQMFVIMLKEVVDIQSQLLTARFKRGGDGEAAAQQIFPNDLHRDSPLGFELLQMEMSNGTIWEYHKRHDSETDYVSNLERLEKSPGQLTGLTDEHQEL